MLRIERVDNRKESTIQSDENKKAITHFQEYIQSGGMFKLPYEDQKTVLMRYLELLEEKEMK